MAALLKRRALAEFSQTITEPAPSSSLQPEKRLKLSSRPQRRQPKDSDVYKESVENKIKSNVHRLLTSDISRDSAGTQAAQQGATLVLPGLIRTSTGKLQKEGGSGQPSPSTVRCLQLLDSIRNMMVSIRPNDVDANLSSLIEERLLSMIVSPSRDPHSEDDPLDPELRCSLLNCLKQFITYKYSSLAQSQEDQQTEEILKHLKLIIKKIVNILSNTLSIVAKEQLIVAELVGTLRHLHQLYVSMFSSLSHIAKATQGESHFSGTDKLTALIKKLLLIPATNHLVKSECLLFLSQLIPVPSSASSSAGSTELPCNDLHASQIQAECISVIKLLRDYSHYRDSRVRSAALEALLKLHERGACLDFSLYSEFCEALNDDYEGVRIKAIQLLKVLSHSYGDCLVFVSGGDEQIRMADDAFAKVCHMITDPIMSVRITAANILSEFTHVSPYFLEQTLDKKLMSNLRRKQTAHERNREAFEAGEWSSGKKWADDAPKELLCPEEVKVMNTGACGAFVHGLEDEFLEVRMACLESLCRLASKFPEFARNSLDFLVDMFNDEIEEVRLKAIQCLARIQRTCGTTGSSHGRRPASNIANGAFPNGDAKISSPIRRSSRDGNEVIFLREDQVEIILSAMEDQSDDIREALHDLLASCTLTSKRSLQITVEGLLDNLKRYPQDRLSIWRAFQRIGLHHPTLVKPLVAQLLIIHPFLDLPEPSIDDMGYLSILILVFNSASRDESIVETFEEHTRQHYVYLRDCHPQYVPRIRSLCENEYNFIQGFDSENVTHLTHDDRMRSSLRFFSGVFSRLRQSMATSTTSMDAQMSCLEYCINDLNRLADLEPELSAACKFYSIYFHCQMLLRKILSSQSWTNAFRDNWLQSTQHRSSLQEILTFTFRMQRQFHGLDEQERVCIAETRLKALAIQLIAVIHGSSISALALCDSLCDDIDTLHRILSANSEEAIKKARRSEDDDSRPNGARLSESESADEDNEERYKLKIDALTEALMNEILNIEDPKPGTVARVLEPFFSTSANMSLISRIGESALLINESRLARIPKIRLCKAEILEPEAGKSDLPHKFTAGLILSVPLHATIHDIPISQLNLVRVKIVYPDQSVQIVIPKRSDFRLIDDETNLAPVASTSEGSSHPTNQPRENLSEVRSYRLHSLIPLSAGVWTEACHVDISLVIDFRDVLDPNLITDATTGDTANWQSGGQRQTDRNQGELFDQKSFMTSSKTSTAIMSKHKINNGPSVLGSILGHNSVPEDQLMIQLCDSVQVYVAPKPVRKGVI